MPFLLRTWGSHIKIDSLTLGLGFALLATILPFQAHASTSVEACLSQSLQALHSPSSPSTRWGKIPTPEDNRSFIALATQIDRAPQRRGSLRFFEVENAVLKSLNDQVFKSKDLVDETENLWRALLLEELQTSPVLEPALRGQYQDFKSLRFALDSSPQVEAAFSQAYQRASTRFSEKILSSSLADSIARGPAAFRNPAHWHKAAVGNSVDEAGLSARYARSLTSQEPITLQTIEAASPWIGTQAIQADLLRKQWSDSLSAEAKRKLLLAPPSPAVPSSSVFELVRKVDFSDLTRGIQELGDKIEKRFGIKLTTPQLQQLRGYTSAVDAFSVGILIPERVVNDLAPAQNGILSADFAGQGGRNLEETAAALARTSHFALGGKTHLLIQEARKAEVLATQRMKQLNDDYRAALERTVGKDSVRRLNFSGDDGIFLPESEWSRSQREQLVRNLTSIAETPSQFRLTYVPTRFSNGTPIPSNMRSRLVYQAEMLEKTLRAKIEGKVSREELLNTTLFVEFIPDEYRPLEGGIYHVIVGTKGHPAQPRGPPGGIDLAEAIQAALPEVLPLVSGGSKSTARVGGVTPIRAQ